MGKYKTSPGRFGVAIAVVGALTLGGCATYNPSGHYQPQQETQVRAPTTEAEYWQWRYQQDKRLMDEHEIDEAFEGLRGWGRGLDRMTETADKAGNSMKEFGHRLRGTPSAETFGEDSGGHYSQRTFFNSGKTRGSLDVMQDALRRIESHRNKE